jgi:hypothetical protein
MTTIDVAKAVHGSRHKAGGADDITDGFPRLSGPLGGWKAKLATYPATAKAVLLGDSTSDPVTGASTIFRRLLGLHSQQGEALHGLGSADYYTNGVANGTTTYVGATATFTGADVGRLFHGKGVPLATVITAVTNTTTVTLSNAVPTGSGLPFWIGRHLIGGGNNGMTLGYWLANPNFTSVNGRYNQAALLTDAPDLVIASWLINDVRQGALGLTVDAIVAAGSALLQQYVDWHRTNLPNADLLLRMPNPMLTANVGGNNFVTDGSTTNPAGLAQIYSTALRRIYLSFVGRYNDVDVIDIQGEVFGTRSVASGVLSIDQLHPSSAQSGDVNLMTPMGGGYVAIADALAKRIGFARNAFSPEGARRTRAEFIVYDAPGAGQIRLLSRDYNVPAAQAPAFTTDSLFVDGIDSPIALTGATIDRVTNNNWLVLTGLGTTDFSPSIGRAALIVGDHAPSGASDREQVFVDLPSIAANSTQTVSVTVPGVNHGANGNAVGVAADPGGGFANTAGLILLACYPTASNTVKLVIQNTTGAAIDLAGESWTFWVLR